MNKLTLPKHVYYDVQVNNFQSTGTASQPMKFSETRSQPIISHSGAYAMSIVRFQLDTYSLPSFIADIEPAPNTDVNKMIETVTLEYDNGVGTKTTVGPLNLVWVPTNKHIVTPPAPAPLQDSNSEYYYGNSFRHYCDLVNTCMASLSASLITAVGGATLTGMISPYLI